MIGRQAHPEVRLPADYPLAFEPGYRAPDLSGEVVLRFIFRKRELLVTDESTLPTSADAPESPKFVRSHYLGTLNGVHCLSAQLAPDAEPPAGHRFRDLRRLFGRLDSALLAVAGHAVQIVEWDRTHRFCGACGAPTELAGTERSRQCPTCRFPMYPRLAPAMIVAVERGEQILLGRSAHFPPGIQSVLAGFVEPGESAEEAVIREVYEETRVVVEDVRYFGSQPWPFPNSLMLGFTAQYKAGEIDVSHDDLEAAGWYTVDELPKTFPGNISISQWLLNDFIARKGGTDEA